MSEVLKVIRNRHSIRAFKDIPLPDHIIQKIEEALILAPSAGNLQARKFFFVTDNKKKSEIARAALQQTFVASAPLVVVGCTDSIIRYRYGARGTALYAIQDVAISLSFAMLVAHEEGLGTVWIGAFDEIEVSNILKLPEHLRPVAIMPIGYPDEEPYITDRKKKEELIIYI